MKFILGIIMVVAGAAIVIKSEAVLKMFGRIPFFEKHLGTEGGSRLGYKLIGLAIFFLGAMTATGLIEGFITWIFSPLMNAGPS